MGLTVLFSTFNGAGTLPRMLNALERLETPPGGWKLVVVDNDSTDASRSLLAERAGRLPLVLLHEPRRGKSCALNAGLKEIEGDLVIFTDDDVIPRPDWLTAFRRVAEQRPEYEIFGGRIYPVWPTEPPEWVLRLVPKGHFAWTDFEDGPADPGSVWGPNMAVRRRALAGHRFFEGIGPDGAGTYAIGSETEFVERLAAGGATCWHSMDVVVGHLVRPHQLTEKWILQRSYNHARGERRRLAINGVDERRYFLHGPRHLSLQIAKATAVVVRATVFGSFDQRFAARRRLQVLRGHFDETHSQQRNPHARAAQGRGGNALTSSSGGTMKAQSHAPS